MGPIRCVCHRELHQAADSAARFTGVQHLWPGHTCPRVADSSECTLIIKNSRQQWQRNVAKILAQRDVVTGGDAFSAGIFTAEVSRASQRSVI